MSKHKPLIGVPADRKLLGNHYFHCVGEKYLKAIIDAADCVPVAVPALGEGIDSIKLLISWMGCCYLAVLRILSRIIMGSLVSRVRHMILIVMPLPCL